LKDVIKNIDTEALK